MIYYVSHAKAKLRKGTNYKRVHVCTVYLIIINQPQMSSLLYSCHYQYTYSRTLLLLLLILSRHLMILYEPNKRKTKLRTLAHAESIIENVSYTMYVVIINQLQNIMLLLLPIHLQAYYSNFRCCDCSSDVYDRMMIRSDIAPNCFYLQVSVFDVKCLRWLKISLKVEVPLKRRRNLRVNFQTLAAIVCLQA